MTSEAVPTRALVVPTEHAPAELEIKRALLTFEEVHLLDPDDRDLMDPAAFMNALSGGRMPVAFGQVGSTALPLPKTESFDGDFERLVDTFVRGGAHESLIIRPRPKFVSGLVIGGPPVPEGWPSPAWTLQTFRALGADQDFLRASAAPLTPWEGNLEALASLRPDNPHAAASSNVLPDLASLGWGQEDDAELLDYLAAARLGSFVKTFGIASRQNLQPFTTDPGLVKVLGLVTEGLRTAVKGSMSQGPSLALHVALVESVLLEQVLDTEILAELSVREVVRLRTRAWGKAQEERQRFLQQVAVMAAEASDIAEFKTTVRREAETYLQVTADLAHEWKKLLVKSTLAFSGAGAASSATGAMLHGILPAPLDVAVGAVAVLLAHGASVSDQVMDNLKARRDAGESGGAALLKPYRFFAPQ